MPRPVLRPNKYQSQFARGGGPRPSGAWDPPRPRAMGGAPGLHVPLHVQRQVVGAREGAVAEVALERPVARVLAVVAREFVRARELPAAAVPVAVVGLLACRERAERASVSLPVAPLPGERLLRSVQPTPGQLPEPNPHAPSLEP